MFIDSVEAEWQDEENNNLDKIKLLLATVHQNEARKEKFSVGIGKFKYKAETLQAHILNLREDVQAQQKVLNHSHLPSASIS